MSKYKLKKNISFFASNKKAIGFFSLIIVFILILMFLLFINQIDTNSTAKDNLDYGNNLASVDLLQSQIHAEKLYEKELFKNILKNIKSSFISYTQADLESKINNFKTNTISSCNLNGVNIYYNSYLNENPNSNSNDNNNNKNNNKNSNNNNNQNPCLVDYSSNFNQIFSEMIKKKLENSFSKNKDIINIDDIKINVQKDENSNNYNVNINTKFKIQNDLSKVESSLNSNLKYDLGDFPNLLYTIQKTLPQVQNNFKTSIPDCISDPLTKTKISKDTSLEKYCIEKSFEDIFARNDNTKSLLKKYDINIISKPTEDKTYYELIFNIINKKTKKTQALFGAIYKDTIPYSNIDFSLSNSDIYDNVIEVTINKPTFNVDKTDTYVVLYSYKDFKDNKKLIDILNKKEIQSNFKTTKTRIDSDKKITKVVDLETSIPKAENDYLDLDFAVVTNEDFNTKGQKTILLYKKFVHDNKDNQKEKDPNYKLLENKELYVYVFAVDKNQNYYIPGFESRKSKFILPISNFGPIPLKNENLIISGEKQGFSNSLFLNTQKYNDPKFTYYNLYIMKDRGENKITKGCGDVSYTCYFYNGKGRLTNKDLNILISNKIPNTPLERNQVFIGTNEFSKNFKLENNKNYEILITPVDQKSNYIINSVGIRDGPVKRNNDYLFPQKSELARLSPLIKEVKVIDKLAPNPLTSIKIFDISNPPFNVEQTLTSTDNLVVNWQPINEQDDIQLLNAYIKILDKDNNILYSAPVIIGKDGIVIDTKTKKRFSNKDYTSSMKQMIIDNIFPQDSSLNSLDSSSFKEKTFTIIYT